MRPTIITTAENVVTSGTEIVKAKRGRKSKQELIDSLNMKLIISDNTNINLSQNNIDKLNHDNTILKQNYNKHVNNTDTYTTMNEDVDNNIIVNNVVIISNPKTNDETPIAKKRGRKPKGGKIVQQVVTKLLQTEEKTNVILHLRCSMKDLLNSNQPIGTIESYNYIGRKNDLTYEVIDNEHGHNCKEHTTNIVSSVDMNFNSVVDNDHICKDVNKEICKKLKYLEHDLHINNVNNKHSACFWDTCEFDNSPIYIPKHFINGSYEVYGCFCSAECAVAYLMNENIDTSSKFERYHLLNHVYGKIYGHNKDIKPAASPYYMLEKYYGNLSIQEYRSLLRNERFFLVIDKPLTRVLPELHEDNDEFILNNKIIPSNIYQVKSKLQNKKQNKTSILNEQFGVQNNVTLE